MKSPTSNDRVARDHQGLLPVGTRLFDISLVVGTGWLAHRLYLGAWDLRNSYEIAILFCALLVAVIFPLFGLYRAWRGASLFEEIRRISLAWLLVAAVVVMVSYFAKVGASYSRVWGVSWFMSAWLALALSRVSVRYLLGIWRAQGHNNKTVVIAGKKQFVEQVANKLINVKSAGLRVLGIFYDPEPVSATTNLDINQDDDPHLYVGSLSLLADFLQKETVDQVWLAFPLSQDQHILNLIDELGDTTADILFVPDSSGLRLIDRQMTTIAGLPCLELSVSPLDGINRLIKSAQDHILAALILLLCSPLMLSIALLIKFSSPGPVLFRQLRHGHNGQVFEIYKFRTMVQHHEPLGRVTQATPEDTRRTRIGTFLRRTSLDELPQFLNVLQGRMSIVGPRPHAVEHNHYYRDKVDSYMRRHKVKPGITGWAQINGYRGQTDTLAKMQRRIEYDLYYIEHWSLWLDLKIIILTIFKGFVHRNAH